MLVFRPLLFGVSDFCACIASDFALIVDDKSCAAACLECRGPWNILKQNIARKGSHKESRPLYYHTFIVFLDHGRRNKKS